MAYNNSFPMNYNYQYQQPQPQYNYAQNQSNNGLIWVQGIEGAKSYLVAPNTTVQLWDSEKPVIYLKSADASGMPSMKVLDYTIRESSNLPHTAPIGDKVEYVTKEELEAFKTDISKQIESVKETLGA